MVFGFPPLVGRTRRKLPAEVRLGGAVRRLQAARCESGTIRGPWLGGSRGGDRPGKLPTMLLPTNAPATDRESFRRRLAVARQALIRSGWHSPAPLDGSTWQRGPGGSTGSGVERNGLCGQKTGIQDLTARVSLQAGPLRAHAPIPQGFPSFGKTANCFF